jgi:hypothetical protein
MVALVNTVEFQMAEPPLKSAYFNLNVCYSNSKTVGLCAMLEDTNERIKKNSVTLVRKRTIPTERPPHTGEVSANFSG